MTWTKHFEFVGKNKKLNAALADRTNSEWFGGSTATALGKYTSYLPEYYAGNPQRLERYKQYDNMDMDSEINTSLDVISDFSTQQEEHKDTPFDLHYNGEVTDSEVQILNNSLRQWAKLNQFNKRIWTIFRSVIKYGDCFFVRDPETFKWLWVDASKVQAIVVNAAEGKEPEEYIITDIDFNVDESVLTKPKTKVSQSVPTANPNSTVLPMTTNMISGSSVGSTVSISASSIVHLSLTEGMDSNWPFGNSILESVFKVYKQKELLEDAIIIYRVQRAPERRIFYIDVGDMQTHKAMAYVERVRNEVHQKRIPNRTGTGGTVIDAAYNPLCLSLDTKIPLLDGRTLPLYDLIVEYQQGKENWVYSCDPITGKIIPGNISWAGITRKNAKVLKLHLDNGESLTVTPDHKIPVLGKGFVEAQNLTPKDSLISYETRMKSLSGDKNRSYQQVYDHELNKWVFTHRMVAEFFRATNKHQEFTFSEDYVGSEKNTVHHKDYNRYNNDPRNLQWMNSTDHRLYHSFVKKDYWETIDDNERERIKNKIRIGLARTRAKYTEEDKNNISKICRNAQRKRWDNVDRESEKFLEYREGLRERRLCLIDEKPEFKQMLLDNIAEQRAKPWPNVQFNWTYDMLQHVVDVVKGGVNKRLSLIEYLNKDKKFLEMLVEANPIPKKGIRNISYEFTDSKLKILYSRFGYKNFKDFVKKTAVYNHRITRIEWLEETIDTGTITVDGKERWHTHHTFATDAGIFVKNSILDDYFFAQTGDGRGSKVETLPGGASVGDITDLQYFDQKLKRGLGVPSSYLPNGNEEGTSAYNDGKLGTAYIQEYRFAMFCKRLQMTISDVFDHEFKLYLKKRGFNIDSSLFEVRFSEPQNFSKFRQIEIDSSQINVFQPLADVPYLSKRFLLQRYLNLSEDEILENERLWKEENKNKVKPTNAGGGAIGAGAPMGLDSVGVRSPIDSDFAGFDDTEGTDELGDFENSSPISGETPETPEPPEQA